MRNGCSVTLGTVAVVCLLFGAFFLTSGDVLLLGLFSERLDSCRVPGTSTTFRLYQSQFSGTDADSYVITVKEGLLSPERYIFLSLGSPAVRTLTCSAEGVTFQTTGTQGTVFQYSLEEVREEIAGNPVSYNWDQPVASGVGFRWGLSKMICGLPFMGAGIVVAAIVAWVKLKERDDYSY
jgi:hypothetical protein